jgi:hypothetical protein
MTLFKSNARRGVGKSVTALIALAVLGGGWFLARQAGFGVVDFKLTDDPTNAASATPSPPPHAPDPRPPEESKKPTVARLAPSQLAERIN